MRKFFRDHNRSSTKSRNGIAEESEPNPGSQQDVNFGNSPMNSTMQVTTNGIGGGTGTVRSSRNFFKKSVATPTNATYYRSHPVQHRLGPLPQPPPTSMAPPAQMSANNINNNGYLQHGTNLNAQPPSYPVSGSSTLNTSSKPPKSMSNRNSLQFHQNRPFNPGGHASTTLNSNQIAGVPYPQGFTDPQSAKNMQMFASNGSLRSSLPPQSSRSLSRQRAKELFSEVKQRSSSTSSSQPQSPLFNCNKQQQPNLNMINLPQSNNHYGPMRSQNQPASSPANNNNNPPNVFNYQNDSLSRSRPASTGFDKRRNVQSQSSGRSMALNSQESTNGYQSDIYAPGWDGYNSDVGQTGTGYMSDTGVLPNGNLNNELRNTVGPQSSSNRKLHQRFAGYKNMENSQRSDCPPRSQSFNIHDSIPEVPGSNDNENQSRGNTPNHNSSSIQRSSSGRANSDLSTNKNTAGTTISIPRHQAIKSYQPVSYTSEIEDWIHGSGGGSDFGCGDSLYGIPSQQRRNRCTSDVEDGSASDWEMAAARWWSKNKPSDEKNVDQNKNRNSSNCISDTESFADPTSRSSSRLSTSNQRSSGAPLQKELDTRPLPRSNTIDFAPSTPGASRSPIATSLSPSPLLKGSVTENITRLKLPYPTSSPSGENAAAESKENGVKRASFISCNGSCQSQKEEELAQVVSKLRTELDQAKQIIAVLQSKLATNDCTVAAYEQSFSNMKNRLQCLTVSATEKEAELTRLRTIIASIRQDSVPTSSHPPAQRPSTVLGQRPSSGIEPSTSFPDLASISSSSDGSHFHFKQKSPPPGPGTLPPSSTSGSALRCQSSRSFRTQPSSRSSIDPQPLPSPDTSSPISLQPTTSLTSISSSGGPPLSNASNPKATDTDGGEETATMQNKRGTTKKSWLLNSLGRAFRKKSRAAPDAETSGDESVKQTISSSETDGVSNFSVQGESTNTEDLHRQLTEKDVQLTDLQLTALSRTHQVEQLKEQMAALQAERDRLRELISTPPSLDLTSNDPLSKRDRLVGLRDLRATDSTDLALGGFDAFDGQGLVENKLSKGHVDKNDNGLIIDPCIDPISPAQRVSVRVPLRSTSDVGGLNDISAHSSSLKETAAVRFVAIGCLGLAPSTDWSELEAALRRLVKIYATEIDPSARLGLSGDSLIAYRLDTLSLTNTSDIATSTPGYLWSSSIPADSLPSAGPLSTCLRDEPASPAHSPCITVFLRGDVTAIPTDDETNDVITPPVDQPVSASSVAGLLDALAFETLIPRTILQRYVSLVLEHRRIILCGPSGTGKTYLANRIADYLLAKSGSSNGSIARFKVEPKSGKELRAYLASIADMTSSSHQVSGSSASSGDTSTNKTGAVLPSVIIIDNLHHVTSLAEIFNGFFSSVSLQKCPFIIGTMNQTTFSATNLQLHHNFRWVLCANHMEPVKGFLGRFLRRRLIDTQVTSASSSSTDRSRDFAKMSGVVCWIAQVWQRVNEFLEAHASSDVTIGPRLFLSCPMDMDASQLWFRDLWNYSLVPYLLEAVREGLQTYGKRARWLDPVSWLLATWPWPAPTSSLSLSPSHSLHDPPTPLLRIRPEDVGYEIAPKSQKRISPSTSGQLPSPMSTNVDASPSLLDTEHSHIFQHRRNSNTFNAYQHLMASSRNNPFPYPSTLTSIQPETANLRLMGHLRHSADDNDDVIMPASLPALKTYTPTHAQAVFNDKL